MKPFDNEVNALTAEIKHFANHVYKTPDNRAAELARLREQYKKVSRFPVSEISESAWNRLEDSVEAAALNA